MDRNSGKEFKLVANGIAFVEIQTVNILEMSVRVCVYSSKKGKAKKKKQKTKKYRTVYAIWCIHNKWLTFDSIRFDDDSEYAMNGKWSSVF